MHHLLDISFAASFFFISVQPGKLDSSLASGQVVMLLHHLVPS